MRPGQLVHLGRTTVCLLSIFGSASAWPRWFPNLDVQVMPAAASTNSGSDSPSATPTPAPGSNVQSSQSPTDVNLNTAGPPSAKPAASGSFAAGPTSGGSPTVSATFSPEDPAGSVVMVTPAPAFGAQLYKAGSYVTFGWSYTYIQAAPSAVDVLLSYSALTWTLTSNMTFSSSAAFLWDSSPQALDVQQPIKPGIYTLLIHDSEAQITAAPVPGYLVAGNAVTFGMYTTQPYTPLAEWSCPTCNSAPTTATANCHALYLAVAMTVLVLFSFL